MKMKHRVLGLRQSVPWFQPYVRPEMARFYNTGTSSRGMLLSQGLSLTRSDNERKQYGNERDHGMYDERIHYLYG